MKLTTRFAAMALAIVLVLGLGMTAACADSCYEMLKYTFSVEDNGDFAWLGQGMLVEGKEPESPEQDAVFFVVDFGSGYASVIGRNSEGQPESCLWMETEPSELLLASMQVAGSYDILASSLDQCVELVMILESGQEQGAVYITNAEEAQAYLTQMQEALENAVAE